MSGNLRTADDLAKMFIGSGGDLSRAEAFISIGDYGCEGWVGLISPSTEDEGRWHCAVRVAEGEAPAVKARVDEVLDDVMRMGAKRAAHQVSSDAAITPA